MLDQFYNRQIESLTEQLKSLRNQYNRLVLNEQEEVQSAFPVNPKTFDTILPPHEERKFRMFMGQIGRSVEQNTRDYDMRGFYADHVTSELMDAGSEEEGDEKYNFKIREGALSEKPKSSFEKPSEDEAKRLAGLDIIRSGPSQISPLSYKIHFPDTYKKPNHPTFSTESRYHGVADSEGRVRLGGEWKMVENHKGVKNYTFTPHPSQIDSPEEESRLIRYFKAVEPHNTLIHPASGEYLHHPYMTATEFDDKSEVEQVIDNMLKGIAPAGSISPEDYAQMRAERARSYRVSGDKLTIPIPMDARFDYEGSGGGVPGRRTGILQTDIDVPMDFNVADIMRGVELTSGSEDKPGELERFKEAIKSASERQLRSGILTDQGNIDILDRENATYRIRIPGMENRPKFQTFSDLYRQLPARSARITQSDIGPLTAGTDPEQGGVINKSPRYNKGNLPFSEDPIDVARFVFSDTHKRRQRRDFEDAYANISQRVTGLRPIEELRAQNELVNQELLQLHDKHGFTDDEMDLVRTTSTEDLKDMVRDIRDSDRITSTSATKITNKPGPKYLRLKALRDLKFKMNLSDHFKYLIQNYDKLKDEVEPSFDPTGADAESVRDLEGKFDMQSLSPDDFRFRRGELPIGREMFANEPRTELDPNRPLTNLSFVGGKFVPVTSLRGQLPPSVQKDLDDYRAENRLARLARIEKELNKAKLSTKEKPYTPEFVDSDRPYDPGSVVYKYDPELKDLIGTQLETGLDAATIRNLNKKRKKAPTKAERAAAEEASAVEQTRNRSIMQKVMGKEEEERSTLGKRLSAVEGLTPSEIERLSAGSIRDVERMGTRITKGDLQRDLAHRAAYRRQSIPLAARPDYLKYLGESVLRLSRSRTIS